MLIGMHFNVFLEVPVALLPTVHHLLQPALSPGRHSVHIVLTEIMVIETKVCQTPIAAALSWPDIGPAVMVPRDLSDFLPHPLTIREEGCCVISCRVQNWGPSNHFLLNQVVTIWRVRSFGLHIFICLDDIRKGDFRYP